LTLKILSAAAPIVGASGRPSAYFQGWLSSVVDALNATTRLASAAAPTTLNIVATGGLQRGGSLSDDVGVSLYRAMGTVDQLPTTGNTPGDWAYALDGRKPGETNGQGTGTPVFWSVSAWFSVTSGYQVSA
jgi:hypothetical protein